MVALDQNGEPVVGEFLHQPHLPQRTGPVKTL